MITRQDGDIAPCVAFSIYTAGLQPALINDLLARASDQLGERLNHCWTGNSTQPRAFGRRAADEIATWLNARRPNTIALLRAVDRTDSAPSAMIDVLLSNSRFFGANHEEDRERGRLLQPEWERSQGRMVVDISAAIRVAFPLDHPLVQNPAALVDWVRDLPLVHDGDFVSGHCGLEVNVAPLRSEAGYQRVAALCAEHPGLGFASSLGQMHLVDYLPEKNDLLPRIRRVDWLTVVAEKAVRHLGGRAAVREALQSARLGIAIDDLARGLLIRAGDQPCLGSWLVRDSCPAYRRVADLLHPVRLPRLRGPEGT